MRSSVTRASGVDASKVAALMMRLRRVTGPSLASPNTSVNTFAGVSILAADHGTRLSVNEEITRADVGMVAWVR